MRSNTIKILLAGVAFVGAGVVNASAGTLDDVKAKGFVQCGVNGTGLAGFGAPDDAGNWKGLDVDACRAVAAVFFHLLMRPSKYMTSCRSPSMISSKCRSWVFTAVDPMSVAFWYAAW